jgi:hypothetical protein
MSAIIGCANLGPVIDVVNIGDGPDQPPPVVEGYEDLVDEWSNAGFINGAGKDKYAHFLALFGKCFVPDESKMSGKRAYCGSGKTHFELLSTYMPHPMEAFAVTIYTNNFNKFMSMHWKHPTTTDCEISSVSDTATGNTKASMFTGESQGSGKYGGWSDEGMTFYNRVFDVIEKQRAEPRRKAFEEKVQKYIQQGSQGGKKHKRPRMTVRNGLSKLKHLVGNVESV